MCTSATGISEPFAFSHVNTDAHASWSGQTTNSADRCKKFHCSCRVCEAKHRRQVELFLSEADGRFLFVAYRTILQSSYAAISAIRTFSINKTSSSSVFLENKPG